LESTDAPLVSVIIPSFNRAHCVGVAINSALAQTLSALEVIVIDDGSSDGTADLVSAINDPRVRFLRHDANRGASAARNTGLAHACGRYIALLDSDDVWLPEKLAAQVELLEGAPEASGVCCTGVYLHLLDHGVTRIVPGKTESNWNHVIAVGCELSPGSTLVARRSVFDAVGPFDAALPRFEDWDWLFRYTRSGDILMVEAPLAHINNRRGRMGEAVSLSTQRYFDKHAAAYAALPAAVRKKAIADAWLQVVANFGFEGRFAEAQAPFLKAFRIRPVISTLRAIRGVVYVLRGRLLANRARRGNQAKS
jgi:glycosyltransferase involved in cell wall biosynthesis